MERQTLCGRVHHHYSDAAICILKSSCFQERTAAGSGDTLSPRADEAFKLLESGIGIYENTGLCFKGLRHVCKVQGVCSRDAKMGAVCRSVYGCFSIGDGCCWLSGFLVGASAWLARAQEGGGNDDDVLFHNRIRDI